MATNEAIGGLIPVALEEALRPRRPWARRLWNTVRQNPLGVFGLVVILTLAIVAIFAPLIAPYRVGAVSTGAPTESPSWSHLFGTDNIGRNMFSRVVFGARISLSVGLFSVGGGTAIALVLGIISGYAGGMIDSL